ncbi:hypothetical protein KUTeg_012135 [Tegillarca granosa]|uniref:Protein-tyrosine-phosphatase n=1 Tax=Tegillarca granosa TaxID=220873 RepID=A0ABQ9F269_TEGGR|nr:hypothetical protein KUTeg_012135 [Tegillarca granosa]
MKFEIKMPDIDTFTHVKENSSSYRQENCTFNAEISLTLNRGMDMNDSLIRCSTENNQTYEEGDASIRSTEKRLYIIPKTVCANATLNEYRNHPYECNRYITCQEGNAVVHSCPTNRYFDISKTSCVDSTDQCSSNTVITTSTMPLQTTTKSPAIITTIPPTQSSESPSVFKNAVILSTVLVAAVIVVVILIVILIIIKRRKIKNSRENDEYHDFRMDPYASTSDTVGSKAYASILTQSKTDRYRPFRPIDLSNFSQIVKEMHKQNNKKFAKDFEDLIFLSPKDQCKTAKLHRNRRKNRNDSVLPFYRSRVKFTEDEQNYINASHVQNFRNKLNHDFIVTQHPLSNTFEDFWTMIWEQNVSVIVSLTPQIDKNQLSYDNYFPSEAQSSKQYGSINVQMVTKCFIQKTKLSTIKIMKGKKARIIKHFKSFEWNDEYDHSMQTDIVQLIDAVKSNINQSDELGPTVVHCGFGTRRSGVYIALYHLVNCIDDSNVDIFDLVLTMRESRSDLIENEKLINQECFNKAHRTLIRFYSLNLIVSDKIDRNFFLLVVHYSDLVAVCILIYFFLNNSNERLWVCLSYLRFMFERRPSNLDLSLHIDQVENIDRAGSEHKCFGNTGYPSAFDIMNKTTTTTTVAPNNEESVCINASADEYRYHPYDCNKYIRCVNGIAYVLKCQVNYHFDVSQTACTGSKNQCPANTVMTTTTMAPTTTARPPESVCINASADEYRYHPYDCNKFIRCVNGIGYVLTCPVNKYFDVLHTACTNSKSQCPANTVMTTTTMAPTTRARPPVITTTTMAPTTTEQLPVITITTMPPIITEKLPAITTTAVAPTTTKEIPVTSTTKMTSENTESSTVTVLIGTATGLKNRKDNNYDDLQMGPYLNQGPFDLSDIYRIVMEMHERNDFKFAKEFQDLENLSSNDQCMSATLQQNRQKNRHKKSLPFDKNRVNYDRYFPSEIQSSKQSGSINVKLMTKCFIQKTELSNIRLKKGKKYRIIKHFQSLGWNDLMDCFDDKSVDIFNMVLKMRESRMHLIENMNWPLKKNIQLFQKKVEEAKLVKLFN